jgi:hypothetical protein
MVSIWRRAFDELGDEDSRPEDQLLPLLDGMLIPVIQLLYAAGVGLGGGGGNWVSFTAHLTTAFVTFSWIPSLLITLKLLKLQLESMLMNANQIPIPRPLETFVMVRKLIVRPCLDLRPPSCIRYPASMHTGLRSMYMLLPRSATAESQSNRN